jgi:hypothetical protein
MPPVAVGNITSALSSLSVATQGLRKPTGRWFTGCHSLLKIVGKEDRVATLYQVPSEAKQPRTGAP